MLAAVLVVLVIGGGSAQPATTAFEAAARGVLGDAVTIRIVSLDEVASDDDVLSRARGVDGVVELIGSKDGTKTQLHCYISLERRWLDREILFGARDGNSTRDALERGRLLGYAVATVFADESQLSAVAPPAAPPPAAPPPPELLPRVQRPRALGAPSHAAPSETAIDELAAPSLKRRSLEFSGVASTGFGGTAGSLGAAAALRASLLGQLSARLFVSGRAGSVAPAQATTRDFLFGGGLAVALPLQGGRFEVGARCDVFVSYFQMAHLSEDDTVPDQRSRWLPGADLIVEGGFRFSGNAGTFVGVGPEATLGKTEIYTHGRRVAVVPVLRGVGEVGFRIGF